MEEEIKHFEGVKGDHLITMCLIEEGGKTILRITLFDKAIFQLFDSPDITVEYLVGRQYSGWIETPEELLGSLRADFDVVAVTEDHALKVTMMINPKIQKHKDFTFPLNRRRSIFEEAKLAT